MNSSSLHNYEIGIRGGVNLVSYNCDFAYLPGVEHCCPRFDGTFSGAGYTIGAYATFPLSRNISLAATLDYDYLPASINQEETLDITQEGVPGLTEAIVEHRVDLGASAISASPAIKFMISQDFSLFVGVRYSYLFNIAYEYEEVLLEPGDITFENGKRVRNEKSGSLEGDGLNAHLFSICGGASYDFKINKRGTMFLSPALFYEFGLNSILSGISGLAASNESKLAISRLHIGLILKFDARSPLASPIEP